MFNWHGFVDRIRGQLPNRSAKKSPNPRVQSENAEPTDGLDPLDGDTGGIRRSDWIVVKRESVSPGDPFIKIPGDPDGISLNYAKIDFDYRAKTESGDVEPTDAKNDIDTRIDHKTEIEILSWSWGSLLRPSVLIPVLLAVGGCIALVFLFLGDDANDDGGNVSQTEITVDSNDSIESSAEDPAEVGVTPTSIGGSGTEVTASASPITTIKVAATPAPSVAQTVAPTTVAVAVTTAPSKSEVDPRFESCELAMMEGFGPYQKGKDREYEWYPDDNRDGVVCDK